MTATAEATPTLEPILPRMNWTDRHKAAVPALEAAHAAHVAAKAQHAEELLQLRGATAAARSASAALEACAGPADRSFAGLVRDLNQANAVLEALGDRSERAERAVEAAAGAIVDAELELKRATIETIDLAIQRENRSALRALVVAAGNLVETVNNLKRLANVANDLEASLPGYQPPWDGQPSHRKAALVQAPFPYVLTSPSWILNTAAGYAAETGV
jgi:hypothetical protein